MNINTKRLLLEVALYMIFNLTATVILQITLSIVAQILLLFIVVGIARKVYPDN